ncbi:zinc finger CCCH-type with G patch domain-containing protein [Teleopsis dalmanni]|uniref:zinc finger CCCH-type with G patch domain-containing protein n=1 Tax=Teleopsis dalmanni TaxID=139649 RepID=UPI0018CE9832|nr:zinc finger CCCH-type with G patch domain-containing protein [Teleopsis dalmanni]
MESYKEQLKAVNDALDVVTNQADREQLESLKKDILELIALTEEFETKSEEVKQQPATECADTNMENELKQFLTEIDSLNNDKDIKDSSETSQSNAANSEESEENIANEVQFDVNDEIVQLKFQELKTKLEGMVGEKCSAPHEHNWGATSYHNAIICGVEDAMEISATGKLDMQLRVLFTNPTHREMLPCRFFLEGHCKFDDAQCHFSHGELVSATAIREYAEPKFDTLARNCYVLAKLDNGLWHKGRVLCVNFVEKECRVRLDGNANKQRENDFKFEDLLPIYQDTEISSSESESDTDSTELDELEKARQASLIERSLFTLSPTQRLGEWEKHTRGIGSKLMEKMGYVIGTGLGSDGGGIVVPISAQVLPKGCSLDYCMNLREANNGNESFFQVEKKLLREQKKQEALNLKAYEREKQRVDVFNFLNDNILAGISQDNATDKKSTKSNDKKSKLSNQTTKALNVESVINSDNIRKKESELAKLKEMMSRNKTNSEVLKRLEPQFNAKTRELDALRQENKKLSVELNSRKTKDELRFF